MAMNNWGGVKEHMSKKPRKFLAHKRVARDLSGSSERNDSFKVSRLAQKERVQNELKIYFIRIFKSFRVMALKPFELNLLQWILS